MPTTISNIPLLLLQSSCFSITLMLAAVLLMARLHLHTESRAYESSRWMLFAALMLYAVHYLMQMLFGFRARGEDVGTLINILFYTPIATLMVCATLRISTGLRFLRRFFFVGIVSMVLVLVLFTVGLCTYHSLHMPTVLMAMEVVYVTMIVLYIFLPGGELRRMLRKIEDETAGDNSKYHLYMRSGTVMLYIMGAAGALAIFSTRTLAMVAAFFLLALVFYVVSFVTLGFSVQGLGSIVEESPSLPTPAPSQPSSPTADDGGDDDSHRLTAEQLEHIVGAIAHWRAERGYSTSNLTSITMAQRLGIPKRLLTQYLAEHEGSTFRVWLSGIRIEESKRMLLEHPDYSIEAIAEACGFSSRSWMQEKFKASTGMTPAEWREAQKT